MTSTVRRLRTSAHSVGFPVDKIGIKAFGPQGLERLVAQSGQPRFRAAQLTKWIYSRNAISFDEMTDLPAAWRETLASTTPLTAPELVAKQISKLDGTRKYLWRLADGVSVESVGLPGPERLTVCFSTQAGCAMGCSFCATGAAGLTRDLAPGEMADQVRLVGLDFEKRVTNAVAMGQGEPFANYEASLDALRLMNSPDALGIGARHLTVSTCGLTTGIDRFAQEPEQFTLAISLHSAVQATRDTLMPGVRGIPLRALRASVSAYAERTGRRPSFEFALIDGVNDSDAELGALIEFTRGLLCHVNLIPVNTIEGSALRRVTQQRALEFLNALVHSGTESSIRTERGADIDAACGQLKQTASAER